jgi:hypothetical protein
MNIAGQWTYLSTILLVSPDELHFVPQHITCTFCRLNPSGLQDCEPINTKRDQVNGSSSSPSFTSPNRIGK